MRCSPRCSATMQRWTSQTDDHRDHQGNPFFAEETIQALFEDGILTGNGQVKVAKSFSQLRIPSTVQAILASRIDHLPAGEKQLLQTAAVIGKVFGLKLIAEVTAKTEADKLLVGLNEMRIAQIAPLAGGAQSSMGALNG